MSIDPPLTAEPPHPIVVEPQRAGEPNTSRATAVARHAASRGLWQIIGSYQLALISFWTTTLLTSLLLAERGSSAATIGLFAAMPWLAVLGTTPLLPRMTARLGLRASYSLGVALAFVAVCGFALTSSLAAWMGWNLLLGFGLGLRWVGADSWVFTAAPVAQRGRVIGVYETLASVLMGCGPLLLRATGTAGALPWLLIGALLGAALLTLVGARAPAMAARPAVPSRANALVAALRHAPLMGLAALFSGLIEGAGVGLFPLYGMAFGFAPATAALLVSVLALGNVVTQYPLGALADRVPFGALLRACLAAVVLAPLLWSIAGSASPLLWPLVFVWGGAVGGLYTLASLAAAQRFSADGMVQAVAACATLYTLGSVLGPGLGGLALALWAPHGLTASLVLVGLVALLLLPRLSHAEA